jgi:hypothetical protein
LARAKSSEFPIILFCFSRNLSRLDLVCRAEYNTWGSGFEIRVPWVVYKTHFFLSLETLQMDKKQKQLQQQMTPQMQRQIDDDDDDDDDDKS